VDHCDLLILGHRSQERVGALLGRQRGIRPGLRWQIGSQPEAAGNEAKKPSYTVGQMAEYILFSVNGHFCRQELRLHG
jgi:hypothetical protein